MQDLLPSYLASLSLVRDLLNRAADEDLVLLRDMQDELQWIVRWLARYQQPPRPQPRVLYVADRALEALAHRDPRPRQGLSQAEAAAARQGEHRLHPGLVDLPTFGHQRQRRPRHRSREEAGKELAQVWELAGLSPREIEVAELVWGEGHTHREAAQLLGIRRGTVANLLARAKGRLTAWAVLSCKTSL